MAAGGRPTKQHKRPGKRHKLLMEVHEQTWLDFKAWCARNGIVASELLEDYMAATAQADRTLLIDTANPET
ncbi:hypothetical protein [Chloroflexus sp.]|uniref:hypothetical protein n=1 Tax=Chloroflexus sp. TaxID=1904827 RepID=UPI002ACEA3EF|nr:hypothetical protein [Chloroflexus sp.]